MVMAVYNPLFLFNHSLVVAFLVQYGFWYAVIQSYTSTGGLTFSGNQNSDGQPLPVVLF